MYFGANFPEMPDSEKLFCGIWAFFLSLLSFPGLTGESVREMSGTSPNMTKMRKVRQ